MQVAASRLNVSASRLLCEFFCRSRVSANIVLQVRIRNTKPCNHLPMCTVVLWTKIVVGFMFLSITADCSDKETGSSCSNVSNLWTPNSNSVPNSFGISKVLPGTSDRINLANLLPCVNRSTWIELALFEGVVKLLYPGISICDWFQSSVRITN